MKNIGLDNIVDFMEAYSGLNPWALVFLFIVGVLLWEMLKRTVPRVFERLLATLSDGFGQMRAFRRFERQYQGWLPD